MEVKTLAENLLFSTVRIEATMPGNKVSRGTGFIFGYSLDGYEQTKEGRWAFFLVTNKHVVEGSIDGKFFMIRADGSGNPRLGDGIEVPVPRFADLWYGHPEANVDLTVMPIQWLVQDMESQGLHSFVAPILRGHVPSTKEIDNMDVTEEILFVGYPNALYDKYNLTPIVRRGTTATPLGLDYGGEPKFLVDASVFPGSSGSPVFVADIATYKDKQGTVHLGASRKWFLGVISAGFFIEDNGSIDIKSIPSMKGQVKTQQMMDLGIAEKSSKVVEAIEHYLRFRGETLS